MDLELEVNHTRKKNIQNDIAEKLQEGISGELYNLVKLVTRLGNSNKTSQNRSKTLILKGFDSQALKQFVTRRNILFKLWSEFDSRDACVYYKRFFKIFRNRKHDQRLNLFLIQMAMVLRIFCSCAMWKIR